MTSYHRMFLTVAFLLQASWTFAEEKVLDFPIYWARGTPYDKYIPFDVYGNHGNITCGQLARAMIVRYWSLRSSLDCRGTYFYYRRDTGERLQADFSEPMEWNEMVPTLQGLHEDDPCADPIARFLYKFCVAQRTHWPWDPNLDTGGTGRKPEEIVLKYFGLDISERQEIVFGDYLREHSWDDLYALIMSEIDHDRPVYLRLESDLPPGHSVVITGYRMVDDHYEFTIHLGRHGGYDPSVSYRIDEPIGRYERVDRYEVWIGEKPLAPGKIRPIYNKLAEVRDTVYSGVPMGALAWDARSQKCYCVFHAGPVGSHSLYFQSIDANGLPQGQPVQIPNNATDQQKPTVCCGDKSVAIAWEDKSTEFNTVYFNLLDKSGERLLASDVALGQGQAGFNRPTISLAWNGSEYAVVWREVGDIMFDRLSADGSSIAEAKKKIDTGVDPHVIAIGDRFAVTYKRYGEVYFVLLDREGGRLTEVRQINPIEGQTSYTPRVAFSGREYGVTWEFIDDDGQHWILFRRLGPDGVPIANSLIWVSAFLPSQSKVYSPNISYRSGEWLLTYRNSDAYVMRISDAGEVIENRYIFWGPLHLSHVLADDRLSILYLRTHDADGCLEVENCIYPLGVSD